MRHHGLTSKLIVRMAIVLVFIALLNFGFSHFFLKERLTMYMNKGIEEKKKLIVNNVNDLSAMSLDEEEAKKKLEQRLSSLLENQNEVTQLAIYKWDEGRRAELFTKQAIAKNENDVNEKLLVEALEENIERLEERKVEKDVIQTFYIPLTSDELLVFQVNLAEQQALEMRIIFANIFGTLSAFVLILIFLYSIFRRQMKPLGEIETYLADVAKGQFSKRLTVKNHKEFSWLAQSINSMVEQIEQLIFKMKEREKDRITHMAFHDDLTNIPNRRMFRLRIQNEIEESEKTNRTRKFYVLFIDVDNFKMINDTLGHGFGDQFLIKITRRLQKRLNQKGELFRLDSDEFTMLVKEEALDKQTIDEFCEELLETLDEPISFHGELMKGSISIGIATYPIDGTDHDTLLRNADAAMFVAKNSGKTRFVHYLPNMRQELIERLELEKDLREALQNDELILHYQPQIDSGSRRLVGIEVLLRWMHPEKGLIPPNKFIPIIERSNLINEVGEWVLKTACKQNKQWQDEGFPKIKVSVNVSPRQFQQPNFVEIVKEALEQSEMDPKYLIIELTESATMDHVEDSYEKMVALKKLGVEVAIDDFGTGYSSLRYLKTFPIDTLKIDREFISEVDKKGSAVEIVTAIIALAHSLNIGLVAEGVETKDQLEFLKNKRCYIIQGFLYSRPLSAVDFGRWIQNWH